jgi:hypothetical protein
MPLRGTKGRHLAVGGVVEKHKNECAYHERQGGVGRGLFGQGSRGQSLNAPIQLRSILQQPPIISSKEEGLHWEYGRKTDFEKYVFFLSGVDLKRFSAKLVCDVDQRLLSLRLWPLDLLLLFVFVQNALPNAKKDPKTNDRNWNISLVLRKQLPW